MAQDAGIAVRISEDKMSADVMIAPGAGASVGDVRQALIEKGVKYGINIPAIDDALLKLGEWTTAASGLPSIKTVHGRIEEHFERPGRKVISDEAQADFKNLGLIVNVKAGEKLATLHDPLPGSPGRTVFHNEIPVEDPKSGVLRGGKNTILDPTAHYLHAQINGRIVIGPDGAISVEPDLLVQGDVGPATGNIDFIGPITITGTVCADYHVKSADTILIKGSVEGAFLDAVNGIVVSGGVFGAGKAVLQCRGDIEIKHAQDATILCGGTIRVHESFLRVTAVAAHEILIETGTILGGITTAPRISAKTIGTEARTRTIIEIGIAPRAKLNATRIETEFFHTRASLLKKRGRLAPLTAAVNSGRIISREDRGEMEVLETECGELERKILELAADLKILLNSSTSCVKGELAVAMGIHPGVVISSVHSEYPIGMGRPEINLTVVDGTIAL